MKILVTGGGTKVRIDNIRSITNEATGSFPSKIVKKFLETDQVDYLVAKNGIKPFEYSFNLVENNNFFTSTQYLEEMTFCNKSINLLLLPFHNDSFE